MYLILTILQIASLKIICTDSTEIFLSKLKSAGLNYHLPKLSIFTEPYGAGGGGGGGGGGGSYDSYEHCSLTLFILFKNSVDTDQLAGFIEAI